MPRDAEVHDVAGVVLHDVQHARAAVRPPCGTDDLQGIGRGEDQSGARGVEHAGADHSGVHGFVA
ncbi:Uncharacterised protein [Mycobacteroides abscessus subsp. abscessus]|nr:Uncharacterised protein [Mycobacteroides abscessus subsp. abscessus]